MKNKNRTTRLFMIGFLLYGGMALLFGLLTSTGGAVAFGGLFLLGAGLCLLRLVLDKPY